MNNNRHTFSEEGQDTAVCGRCGLESCYWTFVTCPQSDAAWCGDCGARLFAPIELQSGVCLDCIEAIETFAAPDSSDFETFA